MSGAGEFVSKLRRAGRWDAGLYEKQVAESLGLTKEVLQATRSVLCNRRHVGLGGLR